MSATPLEARSDATSLIAEEAVSYDETAFTRTRRPVHAMGARAAAAGSCAAAW